MTKTLIWAGVLLAAHATAAAGQQNSTPASAQPLRSTPVLAQPLTGDPALQGKSVTTSRLELAPGALLTNPHQHPGELFGYILEGAILTSLDNGPIQRYEAGQMFYEHRGVTHTHFENESKTEPARVLIILIGDAPPT